MGIAFNIEDPVSTPATLSRAQKEKLTTLVARKNTSLKQEIFEAVNLYLSSSDATNILKGESMFNEFLKSSIAQYAVGTFLRDRLEERLNEESLLRKVAKFDVLPFGANPVYDNEFGALVVDEENVDGTIKRECFTRPAQRHVHVPIFEVSASKVVDAQDWNLRLEKIFSSTFSELLLSENEIITSLLLKLENKQQYLIVEPVRRTLDALPLFVPRNLKREDFSTEKAFELERLRRSTLKEDCNEGFHFFEYIGAVAISFKESASKLKLLGEAQIQAKQLELGRNEVLKRALQKLQVSQSSNRRLRVTKDDTSFTFIYEEEYTMPPELRMLRTESLSTKSAVYDV